MGKATFVCPSLYITFHAKINFYVFVSQGKGGGLKRDGQCSSLLNDENYTRPLSKQKFALSEHRCKLYRIISQDLNLDWRH